MGDTQLLDVTKGAGVDVGVIAGTETDADVVVVTFTDDARPQLPLLL